MPEERIVSPLSNLSEAVRRMVEQHPEISTILIDPFETIIARKVDVECQKGIWAKRIALLCGTYTRSQIIYECRVAIEAALCDQNMRCGFDGTFRYLEMASRLYEELCTREPLANRLNKPGFCDLALRVECAIEEEFGSVSSDALTFLKELSLIRPLSAVTDSCFPERTVQKFLDHHGVGRYFCGLVVSSTTLETKGTAKLYAQAAQRLQKECRDLLIVGGGVEGITLDAHTVVFDASQIPSIAEGVTSAEVNKLFLPSHRITGEMFGEFSLDLYYFTSQLYRKLIEIRAPSVYFLSREGWFLKVLFDRFQSLLGVGERIKSHYLYVSRRSTFVAALRPLCEEHFETLFAQYRDLSLHQFLRSVGFSEEEARELQRMGEGDFEKVIPEFSSSPEYLALRESEAFRGRYEKIRCAARNNLERYLHREGIPADSGRIVVVDVGWKGSIQDNLKRFFGEPVELFGLYLGLAESKGITVRNRKEGILFSTEPGISPFFLAFIENLSLFETLLGAPHGSVMEYSSDGEPILEERPGEHRQFKEVIEPLARRSIEGACEVANIFLRHKIDEKDYLERIAKAHSRMVLFPRRAELLFFERLSHFENFGLFDLTTFKKGDYSTIRGIARWLQYRRDPQRFFRGASWPVLHLLQQGLRSVVPRYSLSRYKTLFGEDVSTLPEWDGV